MMADICTCNSTDVAEGIYCGYCTRRHENAARPHTREEFTEMYLNKWIDSAFTTTTELIKRMYIEYLEAKLAAAKRGDWAEVARLKRNMNGHYGKATGGPVAWGTGVAKLGECGPEAIMPLHRKLETSLYGKRAHSIVIDDAFSFGGTPEDRSVTVRVEVKCSCGRCDACLGPAIRDDKGEVIKEQRRYVPEGGRTRIADQGDAIREGLKKLEAERSAILNRPDPDLAPRIRPKLDEAERSVRYSDAKDLIVTPGGVHVMAHCMYCSQPNPQTFLCANCEDLTNEATREALRLRYIAAVEWATSP